MQCWPAGLVAGALALGGLLMAGLVAVAGAWRSVPLQARAPGASLNLLAARCFLPIGAIWLLLSRLGIAPRDFSALTVFLAALHFHFSGFTLQILSAATGLRLPQDCPRLSALQRAVASGIVLGLPLIGSAKPGRGSRAEVPGRGDHGIHAVRAPRPPAACAEGARGHGLTRCGASTRGRPLPVACTF